MIFENPKVYDGLKTTALIALPVSTFIIAILNALGYENVEVVTAILAAVNTLLGSLVKISSDEYKEKTKEKLN